MVIFGGVPCYTTEMPPPAAEGFASRFVLGPALRTQPDRRLVTLVRSGYETAFEEIVRRYGKPLGRYAAAIVGNRAEDVTQDAFSKALLALRRDNDAEIELRPWLYRIVRNTALNDLRDRPPTTQELAEVLEGGRSAAEEAERHEEITELMQRLRALPEPQRAAIVMRELEGLSHEEIAAALGMSGGAARQAIYRARRALRDGVGLLLPLPLLKTLLAGGAAATGAEVATGAAGVGSAAGAGVAVKAAAATVLVAGTVGAGVALNENRQGERTPDTAGPASSSRDSSGAPSAFGVPVASDGDGDSSSGSGGDRSGPSGEGERGDDRGRRGDDDRSGHGRVADDDHGERSGPSGHGSGSGPDDDDGGSSGHSGSSDEGGDRPDDDSSGSGSSGSGRRSGGGSSGSGHSGSSESSGAVEPGDNLEESDSSGPGSGSEPDDIDSDSGGSDDSSGPGGGDFDD